MRKKIFAALLTAVLVAGCSSENDEPEPAPDDDVTITYPKDTSEHELTDFRCQLVSDESGNHWEIKFDREQVNPFMGGGDEEGVSIVVTNMKDEWKALKDETVVVRRRMEGAERRDGSRQRQISRTAHEVLSSESGHHHLLFL